LYISVYIYRCINNFKFCVYFQMYVYNLYGGIDVTHAIGKMLFRLHVYMLIILFIDDLYIFPLIFTCDNIYYYIMILFKQFYWLSCCHLTFREIWYCLIKTRIDLVSLLFSKRNLLKESREFYFYSTNGHKGNVKFRPIRIVVLALL
jgi:hypothetical protein